MRGVNIELERSVLNRGREWIKLIAEECFLFFSVCSQRFPNQSSTTYPNHPLETSIATLALPTSPSSPLPTLMAKSSHMTHSGRLFAQQLVNSRYSRHFCLIDHINQGSWYRVDTCLASCFVGFLLTWQKPVVLQRKNLG